jgi:hypothetical protein
VNTERRRCERPDVDVRSTCVWPEGEAVPPTWSECLVRGLGRVSEPYVLYLQEDYFLRRPVREDVVAAALSVLRDEPRVGVVYLNNYGLDFRRVAARVDEFVEVLPPARYVLSAQAAIWRKDFLLSLARPWENAWMFEKFGSLRVRRGGPAVLSIRPETMQDEPPFDYVRTGIVKGRWNVECVPLFAAQGIDVSFDRRGFYRDAGRLKSRAEVVAKLFARPSDAARSAMSVMTEMARSFGAAATDR